MSSGMCQFIHQLKQVEFLAWSFKMKNRYYNPKTKRLLTFKQLLNSAFKTFDKVGIVAKQDFTCCLTCGNSEIDNHFRPDSVGYTFYSAQDYEDLRMNDNVYLAFSSWDGNEEKSKEVGFIIKKHLESHELNVDWNGDVRIRIRVSKTHHL